MTSKSICPYCGTSNIPERQLCNRCGTPLNGAPITNDYIRLRQLEFLVVETATWPQTEELRQPYEQQLTGLRDRAFPGLTPPIVSAATTADVVLPEPPPVAQAPDIAVAPPAPPAEPPAPPVPFEQWLLSERNIKFALYAGALLLLLAGLIFVGVNWSYLPGPAKFAVTVMATGLLYLGGYLLYQRSGMRLGGTSLLALASGFVPLNFAVLQIYVLDDALRPDHMWLIASPICLLLYTLLARWTRGSLFVWLSVAAVVSAVTALLHLTDRAIGSYMLAYALLAVPLLLLAHVAQSHPATSFVRQPLLLITHLAVPAILAGCLLALLGANPGSGYTILGALLTVVLFYMLTDIVMGHQIARWVSAPVLAIAAMLALAVFDITGLLAGVLLQVLALSYLGAGAAVERRAGTREAARPLYGVAYLIAGFVTVQSLVTYPSGWQDFARALLSDVLILAVSALIFRRYIWIYGAAWLLLAPASIYAAESLPTLAGVGLALGALLLVYTAVGYVLSRRALWYGEPFLLAAALLSVVVGMLVLNEPVIAAGAIAVIAAVYLLMALALALPWLVVPAVIALDVAAWALLVGAGWPGTQQLLPVATTGAIVGAALTFGAHTLDRAGLRRWALPAALMAIAQIAVYYALGCLIGGVLAVVLSVGFAVLALWVSWEHHELLSWAKLPPLFTYLGTALIFIAGMYALHLAQPAWDRWPPLIGGLCAVFVGLAWILRGGKLETLFGRPLRWSGLVLALVPLAGALTHGFAVTAITFAAVGVVVLADAAGRRALLQGYIGGFVLLIAFWGLLIYAGVTELQAFVAPLGLGLLAMGWNERRSGRLDMYQFIAGCGLLVLLGSAFLQSLSFANPHSNLLGPWFYATLMLVESIAAVAWGMRTHSRGYVKAGGVALLINALAQLGPAFVNLPRWIQLGAIGAILLLGGLAALYQREHLLTVRQALLHERKR